MHTHHNVKSEEVARKIAYALRKTSNICRTNSWNPISFKLQWMDEMFFEFARLEKTIIIDSFQKMHIFCLMYCFHV